jgi:hypothetical protein
MGGCGADKKHKLGKGKGNQSGGMQRTGKLATQSTCNKSMAKLIQQSVAVGTREVAKAMGRTKEADRDKVRWDCTPCLTPGNWASRDSRRGRSAPKAVEPLVLPPGLAASPAAATHPQQQAISMETDAMPAAVMVKAEARPVLAAKVTDVEDMLKDLGEEDAGSRKARLITDLEKELVEVRGKLAETQAIASQLAIATTTKEKAPLGSADGGKGDGGGREGRDRGQEAFCRGPGE